jgi:hypothetical protein
MKTLIALLALTILPSLAHAAADCSLDRVGISVMVTSDTRGPLGNFDAASGENEQGKNTCGNYLAEFRFALTSARTLAKEECDGAIDNVDLSNVEKLASAKPLKLVLGSEFPEACR